MFKRMSVVLVAAVMLSGCMAGMGNKQMGGGLLGAAGGAFLGSKIGGGKGQLAAVAIGALLGFGVGQSVGQSLDRIDQMHAQRAANTAIDRAPTGRTVRWSNPDTGNHGSYTPTRTYQRTSTYGQRQYCREYQQEITVGGKTERAYGNVCRQADGSWRIS